MHLQINLQMHLQVPLQMDLQLHLQMHLQIYLQICHWMSLQMHLRMRPRIYHTGRRIKPADIQYVCRLYAPPCVINARTHLQMHLQIDWDLHTLR